MVLLAPLIFSEETFDKHFTSVSTLKNLAPTSLHSTINERVEQKRDVDFAIDIGCYLNKNFIYDFEFNYYYKVYKNKSHPNQVLSISPYHRVAHIYTGFLNLSYILSKPKNQTASYYVGGGIGASNVRDKYTLILHNMLSNSLSHRIDKSVKKLQFVYNIFIGVTFQYIERFDLDIAYRYKYFGRSKFNVEKTYHHNVHGINLNVRYNF